MKKIRNIISLLLALAAIGAQSVAVAEAPPDWQPSNIYPGTMTCSAYITKGGVLIATDEMSLISAWIDGECVGINHNPPAVTPLGDTVLWLSPNGAYGKTMSFKVYDGATGDIYDIEGSFDFVPDGNLGTAHNPAELTVAIEPNFPNWTPKNLYQGTMTCSVYITKRGSPVATDANSLISAWIEDECVGINYNSPAVTPYGDTVLGLSPNGQSGKVIRFKVYDGETQKIYDIERDYDFVPDGNLGTALSPYELKIELPIYEVVFDAGQQGMIFEGMAMQEVEHNGNAQPPVVLPAYGWKFVGWEPDINNITGDIYPQAQYEQIDMNEIDCSRADMNGDLYVCPQDIYIFAENWLSHGQQLEGDIDGNGWVNFWDYIIINRCWQSLTSD